MGDLRQARVEKISKDMRRDGVGERGQRREVSAQMDGEQGTISGVLEMVL